MSRRSKGARLYLYEREGREPVYVIRDGSRSISTGCGAGDVEGANRALGAYLEKTFRPDTRERDLARIPVAEVLTMYARDQPPDKPSLALIGYHLKALTPFWGDKFLSDVKGSTCRKYQASRCGSANAPGVASSTVRRELKSLQAAINHWHRESPLVAVPKVTLPPEGERRERVLERSEVARLLWAARKLKLPHVARFILIGVYSGTRHAAILGLRYQCALHGGHVDLDRGVIYRRGSAEKETSKRRPPVSCPRRLLAHLARWRRLDDGGRASHVIHFDGQRIAKMKRAWASVVKEAGLGRDVTPHVLRHTCASWLLWEGKTIWDVAGIIGADASTVERVYAHHRKIDAPERKKA
jgi:integrase